MSVWYLQHVFQGGNNPYTLFLGAKFINIHSVLDHINASGLKGGILFLMRFCFVLFCFSVYV